jgi:hypothetical protein
MKYLLAAVAALSISSTAIAQVYHYTQGYQQENGTYVAPHFQTNPNETRQDNWSTQGNTNPFTGQPGTVNPNQPYGTYRR